MRETGCWSPRAWQCCARLCPPWKGSSHEHGLDRCRGAGTRRLHASWHFLYFFPEPHGQGSLRPIFVFASLDRIDYEFDFGARTLVFENWRHDLLKHHEIVKTRYADCAEAIIS